MRELSCRRVRPLLDAYAENELRPDEQEAVRLHLSRCQDCRDELKRLEAALAVLHAHRPLPVPPRVYAQVRARLAMPEPRKLPLLRPARVAAALGICGVAALAAFTAGRLLPKQPALQIRRPVSAPLIEARQPKPGTVPNQTQAGHLRSIAAAEEAGTPVLPPSAVASMPSPASRRVASSRPNSVMEAGRQGNAFAVKPTQRPAVPESFLDVADSRGITARDILRSYGAWDAPRADAVRAPSLPVQAGGQETLHDRVLIGDRLTELRGTAHWDESGRLRAISVRAETVGQNSGQTIADQEE